MKKGIHCTPTELLKRDTAPACSANMRVSGLLLNNNPGHTRCTDRRYEQSQCRHSGQKLKDSVKNCPQYLLLFFFTFIFVLLKHIVLSRMIKLHLEKKTSINSHLSVLCNTITQLLMLT